MGPKEAACVFGANESLRWDASLVVVPAVYKEWGYPVRPPPWLSAQAIVYQYQRLNASADCFAKNVAYESGVYLRFIVDHYHALPSHTVFAQADWFAARKGQPFPHSPFPFWQLDCVRSQQQQQRLGGAAAPAWTHWLPLGLRHTVWPPYQVRRIANFFGISFTYRILPMCSGAHGMFVEWCWREILQLFSIPMHVGNRSGSAARGRTRAALGIGKERIARDLGGEGESKPASGGVEPGAGDLEADSGDERIELTFYPAQNFIASRHRLRQYSLATYLSAVERFVDQGQCARPGSSLSTWPELGSLASETQLRMMESMVNGSMGRPKNFNKVMVAMSLEHLMHAIFGNQPLQGAGPAEIPTHNCTGLEVASRLHVSADKGLNYSLKAPLGNPGREAKCSREQAT